MSLIWFNFLKEDIRLVKFGNCIYKIKVVYEHFDGLSKVVPTFSQEHAHEDIEKVIRAALYILERKGDFRKIQTDKFIITVKTKLWRASQKLGFKLKGSVIKAHQLMIILSVKLKSLPENKNTKKVKENASVSNSEKFNKLKHKAINSDARVVLKKLKPPPEVHDNSEVNGSSKLKPIDEICVSDSEESDHNNDYYKSTLERATDSPLRNVIETFGDQIIQDTIIQDQNVDSQIKLNKVNSVQTRQKRIPASPIQTRSQSSAKRKKGAYVPVGGRSNRSNGLIQTRSSNLSLRKKSLRRRNHVSQSKIFANQNGNNNTNKQSTVQTAEETESRRLNHQLEPTAIIRRSPRKHSNNYGLTVSQLNLKCKDRHFIEQAELAEDMKLQQLAKSSPKPKSKLTKNSRRSSTGIWGLMETIISPVKNIFS